ncbi:hypothetical protein [Jiangella muralis]|uniref:hypothetical protein n=1 Tax=Jiangella muralis TaxID=702383 RepID=UPI00069CEC3B|nr:hypothetical protein [Jiangella muralis]
MSQRPRGRYRKPRLTRRQILDMHHAQGHALGYAGRDLPANASYKMTQGHREGQADRAAAIARDAARLTDERTIVRVTDRRLDTAGGPGTGHIYRVDTEWSDGTRTSTYPGTETAA